MMARDVYVIGVGMAPFGQPDTKAADQTDHVCILCFTLYMFFSASRDFSGIRQRPYEGM